MPARKAPRAIETPNSFADPTAIPSATTSTVSVNSSRERVAAACGEQPGDQPPPAEVRQADHRRDFHDGQDHGDGQSAGSPVPPGRRRRATTTSTRTVKRSSTTSQPTAMWPVGVCRSPLSASTRMSTTVLDTEIASPKTMLADQPHPQDTPTRVPSSVAARLPPRAPGTATRPTASNSSRWNCKPTPNISRMTPISASWSAMLLVGDEARRVRPDDDPRQQIADDRREPEAEGDVAADQRRGQPARQREDQVEVVHESCYAERIRVKGHGERG